MPGQGSVSPLTLDINSAHSRQILACAGICFQSTDVGRAADHFHLNRMIPPITTAIPMAFLHSQGCFSTWNKPNSSMP